MALITCKDCNKEYSTDSKKCIHCGAKKHQPRYLIKAILILIFISWLIQTFGNNGTVSTESSQPLPTPSQPEWEYSNQVDDMTGKNIRMASIKSLNTLSFDFPYQGVQHSELILFNHPRYGKGVTLTIEKGQFLCPLSGCNILVRFDDSKPIRFHAEEPADHSSTQILISNYKTFASKLITAKKVLIEVEFYQNAAPTIEFDVTKFNKEMIE